MAQSNVAPRRAAPRPSSPKAAIRNDAPANRPTARTPAALERLWRAYAGDRSVQLRNELMESYVHLVRFAAERLASKLSDKADVDDLVCSGMFGLLEAVEGFELDRGLKFETYCLYRIRGAMLDDLRGMDWAPRLVRSRSSLMSQALATLESRLGRKPTREELFRHVGLSRDEFDRLLRDSQTTSVVSLSRPCVRSSNGGRELREIDVVDNPRTEAPQKMLQREDLRELLVRGLNKHERLILELYYFEKMTMKEIGMILDLSESRISQMHTSLIQRLKAALGDRRFELT